MIKPKLKAVLESMRFHRFGTCNICGNISLFYGITPAPASVRNTMLCMFCGSSSRKRHVAKIILEEVVKRGKSIATLPATQIRILSTETNDAFKFVLKGYKYFFSSDFFPGKKAGDEISPRVYCQNLEGLTFADSSFDLVITEDVLEHVRLFEKAFKEIYRVLKPGGYHAFTVPFYFDRNTLLRVKTSESEDVHLLPPEYHGDPIRNKILAYRTFGIDLFPFLNSLGFETKVHFSNFFDKRWCIFDSFVFLSRKRVEFST